MSTCKTPLTDAIEMAIPKAAYLCEHWHDMQQHAHKMEEANARMKDILISAYAILKLAAKFCPDESMEIHNMDGSIFASTRGLKATALAVADQCKELL